MSEQRIFSEKREVGGKLQDVSFIMRKMGKKSRRLAFELTGSKNPEAPMAVVLGGTPVSRRGPKLRSMVLSRMGIRLLTYDRPGIGESGRQVGRTAADGADDIIALLEALGVQQKVGIVAQSGGGTYALATAHKYPDRVHRMSLLGCYLPPGLAPTEGSNATDMNPLNAHVLGQVSAADRPSIAGPILELAEHVRRDPEYLLEHNRPSMVPSDKRVLEDADMRSMLTRTYKEALKHGSEGWVDDVAVMGMHAYLSFGSNFSLKDIETPTFVHYGRRDQFTPYSHGEQLLKALPNAEPLQPDDAYWAERGGPPINWVDRRRVFEENHDGHYTLVELQRLAIKSVMEGL